MTISKYGRNPNEWHRANAANRPHHIGRDVYHIESIISYRYHKTDTSIVSKWQINDTFNDDINKDWASFTQKWIIYFLLNACFVFILILFWKLWSLNTVCWVYKKAKRKKVKFLMVWYPIVSYRYHFVSIGIVSYRKNKRYTSLHIGGIPISKTAFQIKSRILTWVLKEYK